MSDMITYIILGFFGLFVIYFVYTLVDTLILSKRNRRKVHSIEEHEVKKIKEQQEKEMKKEEVKEKLDSDKNMKIKKTIEKEKEQKSKKKLFSFGFKKKEKKETNGNAFVTTKIDSAYNDIIKTFVTKTNGSWSQKEFYELILNLVSKGYDKKPSEVQKNLQLVKQEIMLNAQEKSNVIPHTTGIENLDSDKAVLYDLAKESSEKEKSTLDKIKDIEEKSKQEIKEVKAIKLKEEKEQLKTEPEVKEEIDRIKKNKENVVDTRMELDKTLNEIKSLRSKLKNI